MDISALWEDALRPATNLLFPPPSRTVQTDKFDETPARALSIDARYEGLSQSSHLFLAAWALTLLRYSQTDAVVFGFDDDKSVWPVRITLSTRSTLQQLFSQIADCTSRFDQYSSISDCIPSRTGDDGATKLQKLGSILRLEQQGTARKGSWSPIHNGTRPQCAVILNCRLIMPGKEAELSLAYAEKVLSSGQATWLLGQYIHTLSAIQQHSRDEIISDLDLCPSEDRLQIQRWNGAAVSPVSQCIHEVIQEVARGNPYAPAIEGWDSAFTYGELIDAALKLASQLQAKGVQIETTVPLCFERSAWTVVAILAVLRAGGAFMLLDPHHPEERLKSMIERVDDVRSLGSIVCSQAQLQLCTRLSASVIVVDAVHLAEWPVLLEPLATHVGPENTAMIQHTSGTTGFPKGIEVTHGSYCSSVHAHGAEFGIGPDSRVYQFASYSFDACLSEIVTSLMKGACILIPRETDRTDRLAESITELGANWLVLTPSTLRLLQPQDIPTVETLVVGGERVDQDIMDTWAPHVKLFQVWGPSETGVYATSEHISAGNKDLRSLGCIGRPLGCRIWIVDPAHVGHLAPIGCVGELVVEGPTVARGYVTDPNKENPAFIEACNWSGDIDRNIRAYRTGDFGRYDSDGSIIFVGRKDSQVKYHGQRIELAEIEQNITSQPSVKHCVVLLPRSGPYAESIVAILEFQQTTSRNMFTAFEISKSLKAVKDFASNTMPSHMVPATWLYTPKMLLNMATKIDRATLHREVETLNDRLEDHEDVQGVETKGDNKSTPKPREKLFRQAPTATSDVSKIISESFRRALKRKISPDRSFLGQGGDSISAMRIVGSCRKKGVILTFKDVLTAESLEQLSQLAIGNSDKEEKDMPPANLAKEDAKEESFGHMLKLARSKLPQLFEVDVQQVQGMYPCSPAQEGILLSQAKDSEKYMLSYWFDISPQHAVDLKLSSSRLEAAWNIVVQRHQPFRTVFLELISDHGPFAQLVFQSVAPQFTIHSDPSQLASHIPLCGIGSKTLPHHFRVAVEADKLLCRLDVSHAVMDGISVKLVLGELALACEGRLAVGQTFPYQDYISHIFGLSKTKTMEYWNKYLEGINTCHLKLPQNENQLLPDQRRLESFESPLYISRFSRSLIEKEGVPMASLLQAAWALLLSAYTGQNEVSFAYVVSGRDAPIQGIDSAVGLFINTLICRLSLDPSVSAQEWLRAVRDDYLKSSTHQHASVAGITHKLQSSGGYPFNTLVSIVHHWELPKPPGIRLQYKNLEIDENTEFDMTMTATLSEESFGIRLDYWNNLYSHEHVEKVMQTFQAAVNSLLNPSRPCLGELNLISDADLAQLSLWNKTVPSYVDRCIHEVISKQVKARPKAPAICSWDKSFTHRELDRVTDTFACDLLSRAGGMPADTVVPICMEKSAWAVVAMIAVHKAGGGFVLLDPAHPTARLLEIVNKVSASQIVVSKATVAKSRELGCFMVECSEEAHDSLRRHSKSPPSLLNRAGPHSIAYVVFTSGSTGQPKGVVTEHGAYCSGIYGRTEAILRDENSRHLQYASFNFDVCIEDILTTLMVGGCVCMPSEAERVDDIGGAIRRMSVNSAELTPTVADMIRPEEVPSLKVLILSGEAVTSSSLRKWASSVHVINSYGPAESSVTSVVASRSHRSQLYPGAIGHGVASRTWVVDQHDHNRLSPIGATGELLLEGPGLSRGYLGDQATTDQSFICDPSWLDQPDPSRRFYKTGDLVHYLRDGSLIYRGRKDNQTKINGQRVELSEIDTRFQALLPWRATVASVLVPATARSARPTIAAFFTVEHYIPYQASEDTVIIPMAETLRQCVRKAAEGLAQQLPLFMVPGLYFAIATVPTTVSGKIDAKKLVKHVERLSMPELLEGSLEASALHRQPTTLAETKLRELWSRILNLEANGIGADDSFIRLGGDSVLTMQLAAAARGSGLSLTVAMIFQNPRLSDMARATSGSSHEFVEVCDTIPEPFELIDDIISRESLFEGLTRVYSIDMSQVEDAYPCTPLQEGLMAASIKQETAYTVRVIRRLDPSVSLDQLQSAWNQVLASEPILRTRLIHTNQLGGLQVVMKATEQRFSNGTSLDAYLRADKLNATQLGQDLSRCGFVTEDGINYFVWTVHHAIYDGWVLDKVLEQVLRAYKGGRDAALERGPPFKVFIKYLLEQDKAEWKAFWKIQLQGFQPVDYPTRPIASQFTRVDRSCRYEFKFNRNPDGRDYTAATLIRAAWALVVSKYTETDDVSFGAVLTGRTATVKGIADIVGPTFTTVPIRLDLSRYDTISSLLEAVQSQTIDMISFEHAGLQNIAALNQHCRGACDFQNLLVIQPPEIRDNKIGFFAPAERSDDANQGFHSYPLVLGCAVEPNGAIKLHINFDANVISETEVAWLYHHFHTTITRFCESSPDRRLRDVNLFGDFDNDTVRKWNSTDLVHQDRLIHQEISKQVSNQPSAEAVFAWDQSLSYEQLDSLSTQLAYHLIKKGYSGPEVLIPLLLEKSSWVPVCMLAVLKCGAGFVPLDASHPPARLEDIIHQANARVVLVSAGTTHLAPICPSIIEVNHGLFKEEDLSSDPDSSPSSPAAASTQLTSHRSIDSTSSNFSSSTSSEEVIRYTPPTTPFTPSRRRLPTSVGGTSAPVRSNNVAYVIFTSGSTGRPKGVMVEHGQFCSGVIGPRQVALVRSTESRVLQFASLSFDTSLEDILTTLLFGGCVCIPSEHERMNEVEAFINRSRANTAHITPSFANTLSPERVPTLKFLRLGGEAMTLRHVNTWANALDLRNVYGPTETAITATCSTTVTTKTNHANIGKGVAAHIWIVDPDDHDKLTPIGLVGEMLVEGYLLARGYLNDLEKTAKSFISNPKWAQSHGSMVVSRFYKTGDLCHYDNDGNIIYVGRKDTQVKINGQRIELGEVEDHLRQALSGRFDVAVEALPVPGVRSRKDLVAMICLEDAYRGDAEDINSVDDATIESLHAAVRGVEVAMAKTVPKYMIPSRFLPIRSLPTNSARKTDRKKLQSMLSVLSTDQLKRFSTGAKRGQLPQTESERRMQSLWASVLQIPVEQISVDDNFLRIGGDSVMAIRLGSLCRDAGFPISFADIFKASNLREMAALTDLVHAETGSQDDSTQLYQPFSLVGQHDFKVSLFRRLVGNDITPNEIQDAYPCTPLQEGLLSLSSGGEKAYIAQTIFRLPLATDLARFKRAWESVVANNDILRTRLLSIGSQATTQVVLKWQTPDWPEVKDLQSYLVESAAGLDPEKELALYALYEGEDPEDKRFVLTVHHAAYDGWSLSKLLEQANKLYTEAATTSSAKISTAKTTGFSSFIRYLSTIPEPESRQFWGTKSTDIYETSDLPVSTRRPENQEPTMTDAFIKIPLNLQNETVTASVVIRAAWALTIAHYAGTPDVVYGATVLGRTANTADIATVIGPTIATIPMHFKIDGNNTISTFLQTVVDDMIDTTPFEHYGLQNIRSISDEAKRLCDFQSLLVIQPPSGGETDKGLFAYPEHHSHLHRSEHPYPISLEARPHSDYIDISVRFDSNAISQKHMSRVLETLSVIVVELCRDRSRRLCQIHPISKSDLEDVSIWNQKLPEFVEDTVQNMIESRLSHGPAGQALYSQGRTMTYIELSAATEGVAQHLYNVGVGPGSFVPLLFEKSIWHTIAMLGVIRVGAAFVPLDPSGLPAARLHEIISQCRAKVVLTSTSIGPGLPHLDDVEKVEIDSETFTRSDTSSQRPQPKRASPSDTLYVIFTSGTSGTPKGVVISNKAFVSVLQAKLARDELNADSRVLQFASHGFDMSVDDILLPLLSGGCVCIPDDETRLGGLGDFIAQARVNSATMTPSAAATVDALRASQHLKRLRLGGEHLRDAHVQKWIDHVDLKNRYGPTEVCDGCLATQPLRLDYAESGNLGTACGTVTWIVAQNDHSKLLPIGAIGELCVQGPGLADGYLHDQERTAASFVPAPEWAHQSVPMYRTGDLVRYADDGSIVYVRRKDAQVKLRGLRIELGEVEHHIGHMDQFKDISFVVDVRPADVSVSELLAVFVAESDAGTRDYRALLRTLTTRLQQLVPRYMTPTHLLPVPFLPLTTSGKTDHRKLRQIAGRTALEQYVQVEAATEFEEPGTPEELMMRELWAELLNLDRDSIGKQHNFFHMGGDSITVMRLISMLRSRNIYLRAQDVFVGQTLRDVAKRASERTRDTKAIVSIGEVDRETPEALYEYVCSLLRCETTDIQNIVPATSFQAWCVARSSMQCGGWRNSFLYDFGNNFDVEHIQQACHKLVERYEILRTRFVAYRTTCFQIIMRHPPSDLLVNSLTLENEDSYNLSQTPIQFGLDDTGRRLLVCINHALYDGISRSIIIDDMFKLCSGHDLAPTQPFSVYSKAALEGASEAAILYWTQLLQGANMTSLVSHQAPSCRNIQSAVLTRRIPAMKSTTVASFTAATVLKAAWAMVLGSISPTDDVIFASLVQTRAMDLPGIDEIVGPCLNFLPTRIRLSAGTSIHDLLENVQSQYIQSTPYASLGFRQIIECCSDWPRWTRFSSIVHYTALGQARRVSGSRDGLREIDAHVPQSDSCDVWVSASPKGDEFEIKLHYCGATMSDNCAERLIGQLCDNIERCVHAHQDEVVDHAAAKLSGDDFTPLAAISSPIDIENSVAVVPEALTVVEEAWRVVFGEGASKASAPFWNIWGDDVAASELVRLYAMHSLHITVEEVMELPTVLDQARYLSAKM